MTNTSRSLEHLHRLHLELKEVLDTLQRGPARAAAHRRAAENKQQDIKERREQLKQLKMAADQKSLQLKTNEAKIADLKTRLNTASSNREYDIIRSQIDADQVANSVLEDEILEAFEKIDRVEASTAQLERERHDAVALAERTAAEVSQAEPGLRQRASRLEAGIAEAETALPEKIVPVYRRLVERHGGGALARLENRACTACYAVQSPNTLVNLSAGKIESCVSCGRLLYLPAE